MSLRDELIQVAAVAVAIVEDIYEDGGAIQEVVNERVRQDRIWGEQHHNVERWLAILGEEVGEAFKAGLDTFIFPKGAGIGDNDDATSGLFGVDVLQANIEDIGGDDAE